MYKNLNFKLSRLKRQFTLSVIFLWVSTVAFAQRSNFTQYENSGPYPVEIIRNEGSLFSGFDIYKPRNLGSSGELHPILTWGNGTGATPITYNGLLRHMASWGYVVIAADDRNVGSGDEMVEGIDYMLAENADPGSEYYQKLNTQAIGAFGHSQGGAGTINTAKQDSRVTSIAPLAPATFTFPFFYSTEDVNCPMFIMVGAIDALANPLAVFSTSFMSSSTTALYGSLEGNGHFSWVGSAGSFRKYVTAWFEATLKKDPDAEALFFSDSAPIFNDNSWRTITSRFLDDYDASQMPMAIEEEPAEFVTTSFYPNPLTDKSSLEYFANESADVKLTIIDESGNVLHSLSEVADHEGKQHKDLLVTDFPGPGTYYFILEVEGMKEVKRIKVDY
ncbi:poly(ethylene terephthalate) hydrolase family protein [Fulvivirga sediminis]|uniref:T9SS type A sorting domain-containing protein n=1 Tax=Fulvivirga sediminis TaxID=2803949 RepID=A0A937FDH3_9BACT|nr:T9SS type A sorting domain-containing protein [Fulvivirga sediminis]MBL3658905.1 T9SS type A sorting domain-containing protein [Fulvivirga sediminis]